MLSRLFLRVPSKNALECDSSVKMAHIGLLSIKKMTFSLVVAYFFLPRSVATSLRGLRIKEQLKTIVPLCRGNLSLCGILLLRQFVRHLILHRSDVSKRRMCTLAIVKLNIKIYSCYSISLRKEHEFI